MSGRIPRGGLALVLVGFVLGCQPGPGKSPLQLTAPEARLPPHIAAGAAIVDPPATLPRAPSGHGYVSVRVHWPRRTQVIPISADIIHLAILDPLGLPVERTKKFYEIRRPTTPGDPILEDDAISNVAIVVPVARHLTIWARAYRGSVPDQRDPAKVAVAVGSASDVDVFDNVITPVAITMRYLPITLAAITPDNGGAGAQVTLTGLGFFGFVSPDGTPDFEVRFTHRTVFEGDGNQEFVPAPIPGASLSAGTDLWVVASGSTGAATRDSDVRAVSIVPPGAVSGPVAYVVDGVEAVPRKTFRVLREIAIRVNEGRFSGPDHAAVGPVVLEVGDRQQFKARATDSLGVPHPSPAVKWRSDDPVTGVVWPDGQFWARRPGTTSVSIQTGVLSHTIQVKVINPIATANVDVPLPAHGGQTEVQIVLPDYDKGGLNATAIP